MTTTKHVPVLSQEVLEYLQAEQNAGEYLDCTLGGGGHTRQILDVNAGNSVVAIDRDTDAIERSRSWSGNYEGRLDILHSNFKSLDQFVGKKKFRGILADLGTSVDQLEGERGFSFKKSGPLDMRMDPTSELSAAQIVNELSEHDLFVTLRKGGVTKEAKPIARAVVRNRPITDTKQLASIISSVASKFDKEHGKTRHAATLAFQAIRIAVNDEFSEIEALLDFIPKISAPQARAVIISFHSLEDKLVANCMRHWERPDSAPALWSVAASLSKPSLGQLLTRKAVTPTELELEQNPKSRSSRLRAFEFGSGVGL